MIVRIEFQGGFRDGDQIVGDDDPRKGHPDVRRYLFLTGGGRVGERFREGFPIEVRLSQDEDYQRALEQSRMSGNPLTLAQSEHFRKKFDHPVWHVYEVAERRVGALETLIRLIFVAEEV